MPLIGEVNREDVLLASLLAGPPLALGLWLLLRKPLVPETVLVTLTSTTGGTTDPVEGTYELKGGDEFTATAIPDAGYVFDGWFVEGAKVSTETTYTFKVVESTLLLGSFVVEDGPVLIPAYIKPVQNAVAEDWWKVWKEPVYGWLVWIYDLLHLERDYTRKEYVKFKICDAAGNGVPGRQIAVYSDAMPDPTEYGVLYLKDKVHVEASPLILTSDGEGIVTCPVVYMWTETGSYRNTLGRAGRVKQQFSVVLWSWFFPIYDGLKSDAYFALVEYERLQHPVYRQMNAVHAYWVENPNLAVWGDCYVDCMVKLEGSKTL